MKQNTNLEGVKLFVATPMYGGMCYGSYAISCINLQNCLNDNGVRVKFGFLYDDALVPRARNNLVYEFLQTKYTHLMFIDGDIEFSPEHVLSLLWQDVDVLGGPYAKKHINWEKISHLLKVYPDISPQHLQRMASDFVFHSKNPLTRLDEMLEVEEAGTGFLLIKRDVFLKMIEAYPQLQYRETGTNEYRYCFFPTPIDSHGSMTGGGTDRYLSEDYAFCSLWRKIGGKIMMAPWVVLNHIGNYSYTSDFFAMQSILKHAETEEKPTPSVKDEPKASYNLTTNRFA